MSYESYEVRRYRHGVAVIGAIPVNDFAALTKAWSESFADADSVVDALISQHLGASVVVATAEGSRVWRAELGLEVPPK